MVVRKKSFLYVAVPFAVFAVGLSFVSLALSVVVTVLGLGAFVYLILRPTGRALAHSACTFCARKIIFEHQGEVCGACNEGVHGACMDEHRMAVHAPANEQPFR